MEVLSALRVTSLTSKFPGVSATDAPPVTAIEYRWFQPFCSEANTIRFPTTKCRDASAVNRGNDPFSSLVLCQILRALPVVTSATHNAHGTGATGTSGCFSFNPGARMKTICLPSSEDRKSTRLNSSHGSISYAVFCLKKKKIHVTLSFV